MKNKKYWDNFYTLDIAPKDQSKFAEVVLEYLIKNDLTEKKIIDVACGNGRDTYFFLKNDLNAFGIDLSVRPGSSQNFIQDNILTFDYTGYEMIYLRFIVHALSEDELNVLLDRIIETSPGAYLFIETRSSKGITNQEKSETYFKSSVGEEHFRMLYSLSYLESKMSLITEILDSGEGTGFSEYKGDDPECIRMFLKLED